MKSRLGIVLVCVLSMACGFAGSVLHSIWASPPPSVHYPGSSYFSDVSPASPHDDDIGYLRECGVVQGYPDGTYGPNVTVTREQMATYVARALAFGAAGGELLVDYDYFDGWYWGEHSYQSGWITYEEYQIFGLTYLWLVDMIWAHLEQMGYPNPTSAASPAAGPLSDDVVRRMWEVRERLEEQGVPPPPSR